MEKLEDIILKKGDLITLESGESFNIWSSAGTSLKDYNGSHNKKIVELKRPLKYETIYQKPQEILDKEEKEYLSAVIRPFRNQVVDIRKYKFDRLEWIEIDLKDGGFIFPGFDEGTMYKGMETGKEYSLEELGL